MFYLDCEFTEASLSLEVYSFLDLTSRNQQKLITCNNLYWQTFLKDN